MHPLSTALLVIKSVCRNPELHALCYKEPYLTMSDARVVLYPNIDFLSKLHTRFHVIQPIEVLTMYSEDYLGFHFLCVRSALKLYLMQTERFTDVDNIQLFLTIGGVTKGKHILKQGNSKWLVEMIKCAYAAHDLDASQGINGHQTRKQAVPIAEMAGIVLQLSCKAATWASCSTFARLNLMVKALLDFGRRVLTLAGSSSREAGK